MDQVPVKFKPYSGLAEIGHIDAYVPEYRPVYKDMAYTVLAAGKPIAAVAAMLRTSKAKIAAWRASKPEFEAAVAAGLAAGEAVWMEYAQTSTEDGASIGRQFDTVMRNTYGYRHGSGNDTVDESPSAAGRMTVIKQLTVDEWNRQHAVDAEFQEVTQEEDAVTSATKAFLGRVNGQAIPVSRRRK